MWCAGETTVDNSLIGVTTVDGTWVIAAVFEGAYKVSFNTGRNVHGCVHSEPAIPLLKPGEEKRLHSRVWLIKGNPRDIFERFHAWKDETQKKDK